MNINDLDVEAFKQAWFTDEEIEDVKEWILDIENGNVFTETEIYDFVENELFSKYKMNA